MEGDVHLILKTLVKTTQQSTATSQIDTILHNIGIQLWRRVLKGREHCVLNLRYCLIKTMGNLLVAYRHLHWQGCDAVRTMHDVIIRSLIAQVCQGRTYVYLDTLSHTLGNLHVVLAIHILLDVGCQIVACHTDRVIRHYTTQ